MTSVTGRQRCAVQIWENPAVKTAKMATVEATYELQKQTGDVTEGSFILYVQNLEYKPSNYILQTLLLLLRHETVGVDPPECLIFIVYVALGRWKPFSRKNNYFIKDLK